MKVRVYVAAGLLVGTIATSTTTFAADDLTCTISGTGPDSNNTCLQFVGRKCKVVNNTTVIITNTNDQDAESGDANSSGNTGGGGATSGSAGNTNGSTVDATIDNTGACVAATAPTTPTTPTPTEQPQVQAAQTTAAPAPQVVAPVGGVAAGVGSTDTTGVLVSALAAGVAAIGFGLRRFASIRK